MKRRLILGTTLAVVAGLFTAFSGATAANAATTVDNIVAGCGESLTVHVPAPGQQLSAAAAHLPSNAPILQRAAAAHVRWLPTLDCRARPITHVHTGPGVNSTDYSSNWSGYIANTSAPNYVQQEWTEPSVSLPASATSAYSSIWPGMGGASAGSQLIQDGTAQDVTASGQTHYFWFELVPQEAEQQVTNLVPHVGDDVATSASYDNGVATFTTCDYTQQACVSGTQDSPAPGNTAEWIVERPTVNNSLPHLGDFGTVTITNASYDLNSQGQPAYAAGSQGADQITMLDSNSRPMATPSALSDNGAAFSVTWQSAG